MSTAARPVLDVGTDVGGWRLAQPLGPGAVGPVWRAERAERAVVDDRTDEPATAVLKFADPDDADRADGDPPSPRGDAADRRADRLAREARLLARLSHPGIVPLLGVGRHGRWAWIALGWVDGPDLAWFLQPGRRLTPIQAAGLIAQAADALDHAHRLGIVHRDLKPSNIRIDRGSRRARLLDFGVATEALGCRTRTGLAVGSPAYQAPELLAGGAPDVASDLFALGVTLFELLAGRRPWQGDSLGALLRSLAQDRPADLAGLRPDLPPALVAAVHDCLAADPRGRPAGARVLAVRLRAAVGLDATGTLTP